MHRSVFQPLEIRPFPWYICHLYIDPDIHIVEIKRPLQRHEDRRYQRHRSHRTIKY